MLLNSSPARAVVIFGNAITNSNPSTANPFTAGQTFDSNITVSGIGRGTGINANAGGDRYNATAWNLSALDLLDYFTFTLTPTSGFSINFDSLTGTWQTSGTGPRNYAFRSSLDGFTSNIATGAPPNNSSAAFNLSLSAAAFDSITTAIEFRIYGWGGSNAAGTFSINDFAFNGTVSPAVVPGGGNFWDTNGSTAGIGGLTGTWTKTSATWNDEAGTGTPAAFDRTKELVFAGTAGTVNIDDVNGAVDHNSNMRFDVSGYVLQGDQLAIGETAVPFITVTNAAHTATISAVLTGGSGLNKAGAGTLVLGGNNASTLVGDIIISGGTLQISSESNLGGSESGITLGGGTLKTTATMSLQATRAVTGSGGLDVANGTVLTVNGDVTLTGLALANTGTLDLQGATNALGAVTISANATVQGKDATITGITATHTGTATISNNLGFGTGDKIVSVNNAAATLALSGDLSGARIQKTGAGTLEATGDNAALVNGFQLGIAGAAPTAGGTLKVGHKNGLGTGAGSDFRFNYGTLFATTALTGANAIANNGLSIGGRTGAAVEFAGSNMEVAGTVGFFKAASTSGQMVVNVSNTTTLSGNRTATDQTGGSGGTLGTATGITFGGPGKLILSGNWSTNTLAVTVAQSLTLEINNAFTGNVTVGDDDAANGTTPALQGTGAIAGDVIISADGTLRVGTTDSTEDQQLFLSGSLTSSGTLELDIFSRSEGENPTTAADMLTFNGPATAIVNLTGILRITNLVPGSPATTWGPGDSWQLIDWGSILTANRTVNFSTVTLPTLTDGMEWINTLSTDGRITISGVPEPGRMLLLLMGGTALLLRRRRKSGAQPAA